jgi:hypothetical protein
MRMAKISDGPDFAAQFVEAHVFEHDATDSQ